MKFRIWKTCLCHCKLDSFLVFKDCSGQIGDITKCDLKIFVY